MEILKLTLAKIVTAITQSNSQIGDPFANLLSRPGAQFASSRFQILYSKSDLIAKSLIKANLDPNSQAYN